MQLVIKIDDKDYQSLKDGHIPFNVLDVIKNGMIIPKGHGDLIDKSNLHKAIYAEEDNCTGMGMMLEEMDAYNEGIDAMYNLVLGAKSIIEADRSE